MSDQGNRFFSKVSDSVIITLDNRKSYNSATVRNTDAHNWLFKKTAYAEATAYDKNGKSISLKVPTKGGFESEKNTNALYNGKKYEKDNARFLPKPHINTVKISTAGDFGSLRKADISFTVYSKNDLDLYYAFLTLGNAIILSYGWNRSGGAFGAPGKFIGSIYNFSYTVNVNGGFDCMCYAMGKGIAALSGNINAGSKPQQQVANAPLIQTSTYNPTSFPNTTTPAQVTDAFGVTIKEVDLTSALKNLRLASPGLQHNEINEKGIGVLKLNSTKIKDAVTDTEYEVRRFNNTEERLAAQNNPPKIISQTVTPAQFEPYFHYYISLEKLIELINNKILKGAGGKDLATLKITCNSTVTTGNVPTAGLDSVLVSGNLLEVAFPGFGDYVLPAVTSAGAPDLNSRPDFHNHPYKDAFKNGDLSKTMLNIDWIIDTISEMSKKKDDIGKSLNLTIGKFLGIIFDSIYINSGTRFKLTAVTNQKDETEWQIVDSSFIPKELTLKTVTYNKKFPYEITTSTKNSICRSVSLTSKVPSAMQAAAFISAQSTFTPGAASIVQLGEASKTPESITQEERDDLQTIAAVYFEDITNKQNISSLQSALARAYNAFGTGVAGKGTDSAVFPIDFSCTLDGINGFEFGNVITTNYLPSIYQKPGTVAFTITKIEDTISASDWTTTLGTVCRILPIYE